MSLMNASVVIDWILQFLVMFANIMADAVEQMCFAKSHAAVDEEGIVRFAGTGRDAERCRFDELVRGSFDEIFEGIKRS